MSAKTCCFIGHSEIRENISEALTAAVERHITEYGVTDFLVGNYGAFDHWAATVVKAAKARHSNVRLYLMLPYMPGMGRPLPDMEGYDGFVYPEGMENVPYKLAIPKLNRIMVEDSDYVIAYVTHSWGGAARTLELAEKRKRQGRLAILNLGESVSEQPSFS